MAERIFVAVAWPYTNGPRHLGHVAGFGVPSDVFARYAADHLHQWNEVRRVERMADDEAAWCRTLDGQDGLPGGEPDPGEALEGAQEVPFQGSPLGFDPGAIVPGEKWARSS